MLLLATEEGGGYGPTSGEDEALGRTVRLWVRVCSLLLYLLHLIVMGSVSV